MNVFEQAVTVTPPTEPLRELRTLAARVRWRTAASLHEMRVGSFGLLITRSGGSQPQQILFADEERVHNLSNGDVYLRRPTATSRRVAIIPETLISRLRQLDSIPL